MAMGMLDSIAAACQHSRCIVSCYYCRDQLHQRYTQSLNIDAFARVALHMHTHTRFNSLCGSYPDLLVVPQATPDQDLLAIAAFRSEQRIPALTWGRKRDAASIWRSSQPRVGMQQVSSAVQLVLPLLLLLLLSLMLLLALLLIRYCCSTAAASRSA
jgi:hypothetical protein